MRKIAQINGKPASLILLEEKIAREQGLHVWNCSCGSGFMTVYYAAFHVEKYHPGKSFEDHIQLKKDFITDKAKWTQLYTEVSDNIYSSIASDVIGPGTSSTNQTTLVEKPLVSSNPVESPTVTSNNSTDPDKKSVITSILNMMTTTEDVTDLHPGSTYSTDLETETVAAKRPKISAEICESNLVSSGHGFLRDPVRAGAEPLTVHVNNSKVCPTLSDRPGLNHLVGYSRQVPVISQNEDSVSSISPYSNSSGQQAEQFDSFSGFKPFSLVQCAIKDPIPMEFLEADVQIPVNTEEKINDPRNESAASSSKSVYNRNFKHSSDILPLNNMMMELKQNNNLPIYEARPTSSVHSNLDSIRNIVDRIKQQDSLDAGNYNQIPNSPSPPTSRKVLLPDRRLPPSGNPGPVHGHSPSTPPAGLGFFPCPPAPRLQALPFHPCGVVDGVHMVSVPLLGNRVIPHPQFYPYPDFALICDWRDLFNPDGTPTFLQLMKWENFFKTVESHRVSPLVARLDWIVANQHLIHRPANQ